MIINSNLPASDLLNQRAADPRPPQTSRNPASDGVRDVSLENDWDAQDSTAVDAWTNFLTSNILSHPATALAAQGSQNPATVLSLLQ